MEKQEIIDYVMRSPENTNPAVLGTLLDAFNGGTTPSIDGVEYQEVTAAATDRTEIQWPSVESSIGYMVLVARKDLDYSKLPSGTTYGCSGNAYVFGADSTSIYGIGLINNESYISRSVVSGMSLSVNASTKRFQIKAPTSAPFEIGADYRVFIIPIK